MSKLVVVIASLFMLSGCALGLAYQYYEAKTWEYKQPNPNKSPLTKTTDTDAVSDDDEMVMISKRDLIKALELLNKAMNAKEALAADVAGLRKELKKLKATTCS